MKKRNGIVFIICLVLMTVKVAFSQDTLKVDSLRKLISSAAEDTNKVRLLQRLSYQYVGNDEKEVFSCLNKALTLSEKLDFKTGTARTLSMMGTHYFRTASYIESISTSVKAASLYYNLGDDRGVASILVNIGNVYYEMEEYERALDCLFYSLRLQQKQRSARTMVNTMNTIGQIYQVQGEYENAQLYIEKAFSIMDSLKNELGKAKSYNLLGRLYLAKADTVKALEYLYKSEEIYSKKPNKSGLASTLNYLGKIFLARRSYEKAVEYFKKSLTLAGDAEARETLNDVYSGLASAYEKMNRLEDALKYYKLYYKCEDSVFDASKQKLMEIQYKLESEKNEGLVSIKNMQLEKSKIEIQKQNLQVFAMSIGGFLLMALLIISYISYKRKKKDNKIISAEKKRSEDLLLNILPEEIAEELKQNGKSTAKKIELVSVLFADFVSFSRYAGMLDPEEVVKDLDFYFRAFDDILNKYDIEKIKTIGDAYMCAGGVPGVNNSNPLDVVRCGLEMRDFVEKNKRRKIADNEMSLEMRIGIHTGPVVAGIVGVKKFSYDIWGDTVNIASRLQTAGEKGKVNISEATYQYIKDDFKFEPRGKIPVKNIGEVEMYFVEPL